MGNSKVTLAELGSDLGFRLEDGELILTLGSSKDSMRRDMGRLGADMRKVLSKR